MTLMKPSSPRILRSTRSSLVMSPTVLHAEDVAGVDLTGDADLPVGEVHDGTVLDDDDVLLGHSGGPGQRGIGQQVAHLAVHRHRIARPDDVVAVEQLAGARMAGDVHQRIALVNDRRAQTGQPVDHPVDGVLVARDEARHEQDGVALGHIDDGVLMVGDATQGAERLALGTGRDDDDLVVAVVLDVAQLDQGVAGDPEVSEVAGHTHGAHHRPAHVDDLAVVLHGQVHHLLDAVDVRGEAGHDQLLLGSLEDPLQRREDVLLGRGETGHLGIGRVGHEQVDTLGADAGEAPEVGDAAVEGQLVHLEVAGVQHRPADGADEDGQGVGDGVVDGEELQVEVADAGPVALRDHLECGVADAVFAQLALEEGKGQRRAPHRDVAASPQEMGNGADVVLVAVGEDDADDVVHAVGQMVEAGQDQVDPRMVVLGEEHATVDQQDLAVDLEAGHVAADVTQPAERDDPQGPGSEGGRRHQLCWHGERLSRKDSGPSVARPGAAHQRDRLRAGKRKDPSCPLGGSDNSGASTSSP